MIDQLRGDELDSVTSEVRAGRRDHILKSLDERGRAQELVGQQYSGRYPFELLQNANDAAADAGRPGRVRFVLTDNAILVADNGAGFGDKQIRAICRLGRSSKDARKSVGYKGLGFKSVSEITAQPQIVSDGVAFQFDDQRVRDAVERRSGPLEPQQRLPIYAFPFGVEEHGLGPDAAVVDEARSDGLTTVIRLPLKSGVERSEVEKHLIETLVPRLLLFLTAIEELELRGTSQDFISLVSREINPICDEILLESSSLMEHWLVYRQGHNVDRALVAPLGDAWAEVERVHVAVAVPLDSEGRPTADKQYPLHVYFPTEERTGFPVLIHGDFALELDRRRLAANPEAVPYNETLIRVVAAFLGEVVAPELATRYPGRAAAVAVLTPHGTATGLGELCVRRCIEALQSARFLPAVDGKAKAPAEALLLPSSQPDSAHVHHHLDLTDAGRLLIPAIDADPLVRDFLLKQLQAAEWPLDEALRRLVPPAPGERTDFYELLVAWADAYGSRRFASALKTVRCVLTTTGDWVTPAERVFFPRVRDDVEVPADLPVPIADVPPVDGLQPLLSRAGVRDFEWRELLRDYLLPLLTSGDTEQDLQARAINGLRAYYQSQRAGDPTLQRRIKEVLLPATTDSRDRAELRAAGSIYFSKGWTGSSALEQLYGPFREAEFLAVDPPADKDERQSEMDFLRWMGVAAHPRVLEARAEQRDIYMTDGLGRHPHQIVGQAWDNWWVTEDVEQARRCGQNHPWSQQLRSSFALDRFCELTSTGDATRMLTLWSELARNWGAIYEPATHAVFHCQHTGHGGDRDRRAPSLLWHSLVASAWLPARRGDQVVQVRPGDAWRLAFDTPKWVAKRVPILDAKMVDGPGVGLAAALEVTDAARPKPADIAALLDELRREHEASDQQTKEIHVAARWAMRTLNDVLIDQLGNHQLSDVPLLARYRGEARFTTTPVVALDPLLAETWEEHYPILDADRDLRRLHEAFNLIVLDDPSAGVHVTPIPQGLREDLQSSIGTILAKAKPFLAAAAVANTPSREDEVLRALKRLEVSACDELVLRFSFRGRTIDRNEAVSYIAVRQETVRGAIRRNIGTAHLQADPRTGIPDWYAFGPQLAQFLQVPTQGDAFAVLLTGRDEDRVRYLASRRISLESVDAMRSELDLTVDDELPNELFDFLNADADRSQSTVTTEPRSPEEKDGSTPTTTNDDRKDIQAEEPPPDLDLDVITIEDVDAREVDAGRTGSGGEGGGSLGPAGPIDHDRTDRQRREIGRRGEQAAVQAERKRVESFGGDPSAVMWRSEHNPFAPYDIESLDEDGQRIYIEVKSTASANPADPFIIGHRELLQSLRHRSRYYIYRVTLANTAGPVIHRFQDPAGLLAEGRADLRLSDARMALGAPK